MMRFITMTLFTLGLMTTSVAAQEARVAEPAEVLRLFDSMQGSWSEAKTGATATFHALKGTDVVYAMENHGRDIMGAEILTSYWVFSVDAVENKIFLTLFDSIGGKDNVTMTGQAQVADGFGTYLYLTGDVVAPDGSTAGMSFTTYFDASGQLYWRVFAGKDLDAAKEVLSSLLVRSEYVGEGE